MPAWAGSDRRSRLPANWESDIRPRILRRDRHRCTADDFGQRCLSPATDVDHVVPGDDHRDGNLTSLCGYHHDLKSASEGNEAKAAKAAKIHSKFRRQPEPHPGSW